jgi:hypothetical protein
MKLLSRKDIANLTGLTLVEVRRNEARIGLRPIKLNLRSVRYQEKSSLVALRAAGLLSGN